MITLIVLGVGLIATGAPMLSSSAENKRSGGLSMVLVGIALIGFGVAGPQPGGW